jgi:hypothetical protein
MRREIFLLHSQPSVSAEGAPTPEAKRELGYLKVVRSKSVEDSESEARPDFEG